MGGITGKADGTADNNAFDWEDEMGDEAINLPARRKTKQNYKSFDTKKYFIVLCDIHDTGMRYFRIDTFSITWLS